MNILKVSNLKQLDGSYDYKNLDISKIVAGSQLYPEYENTAYFYYVGEINNHSEISIITEEVYNSHKQKIKSVQLSADEKLKLLEEKTDKAIMELTMLIAMGGNY